MLAKDIKNNGGARCQSLTVDRTAPTQGLIDANGASLYNGGASSMTTITVTSTDTFGLAQITLVGPTPGTHSVTGYTATEVFSGLANGSYTASVTDLAGNVSVSAFIISTSSPDISAENDTNDIIPDVIPSSRCLVIHATDANTGIAAISVVGDGLSQTMTYTCGIPAISTDVYAGTFCNLTENSTYTYTVTNCAGEEVVSSPISVATSTLGGIICVTSPAGTYCGGVGSLTESQINNYGTRIDICMYTGNCPLCSVTGYDNITSAPAGSAYCGTGPSCCRTYTLDPPLSSTAFTVTNTTDVTNGDSGSYKFSITNGVDTGEVSLASLASPTFKMTPGQSTGGKVDIAQIGQGYPRDSSDDVVHIDAPFTRLHFSLWSFLDYLLGLARQLLRASSPYVYGLFGSDAIFSVSKPLTFTYVDTVDTDTTTVRIYRFDGVSWSSSGITGQTVSYSTTTNIITVTGEVDRTGFYATLYQAHDSSAPITTFSIQGSSYGFDGAVLVSTDTYLVLTATDPVVDGFASTVASVTYRIDPQADTPYSIYTDSIPVSLGTHIFEYRALDYAGNVETTQTSTVTVTAGAAFRASGNAHIPGILLNGFLGSGAQLELVSQAQNDLTLLVSSANREGMVSVNNIGQVGFGVTPLANLDVGASPVGLQLRSGDASSASASTQIAFGYNGDYAMSHLLRTRHSTSTDGNRMDFLVWNPGAGSTTTAADLGVLSIQGIATASGGSFHAHPVGEPDAEVEVSDGITTGGGTLQRLDVVTPSSRRFKTNIKDLNDKAEDRALEEVAGLRHARFRYKARGRDGRLVANPARPLRTGLIYEEAPKSIRDGKAALSTTERLVNVEMALRASMRRLEELQARYERLKARRKKP